MGRVVLVTGASSGIGREAAVGLARQGNTVVVTSRDPGRGEAALADVRARAGAGEVHLLPLDLASFTSIRDLAGEVLGRFDRLDVLINNAGAVLSDRLLTDEGYEMTFGVNHLGHFLLTGLLVDRLRASAPARVVTVTSLAHRLVPGLAFDDLQSERGYSPILAYSASKLANVLFSSELARRLAGAGVTSNAWHPMGARTGLAQDGDTRGSLRWAFAVGRPFFLPAATAARALVHVATSPALAGTTGGYFALRRPSRPSGAARDPGVARRLWEVSEELVASA